MITNRNTVPIKNLIFTIIICFSASSFAIQNKNIEHPPQKRNFLQKGLTGLDYSNMTKLKREVEKGKHRSSYRKLIRQGNKIINEDSFSVIYKPHVPPSGDRHDYMSIGPYWWPDLSKPDSLPWINRDGKVNPLSRGVNSDYSIKSRFFKTVYSLSLAYFFSEDSEYAVKATQLLHDWFINPKTKMNPNLNYAQGIPGKRTGRSSGIIEFSGIRDIISSIEILESQQVLDKKASSKIRVWIKDYLQWLQTSDFGIEAKGATNNHGTWYDVQVVCLLIFLDEIDKARQYLQSTTFSRLATQINPDGSQPRELGRTKALHYSTINLHAFTLLAYMGQKVEVDLWNYESDNGSSIQKAFYFLKPYAINQKEWKYPQITDINQALENLRELFAKSAKMFNHHDFCEVSSKKTSKNKAFPLLLFNCAIH
ncbi:alginate lyase family protein [Flagellimonas hymeniacidonis]|uniref:Alginate lyase family protein n=1 Tax=Flagellimonas hymeniacidonis TaxID=2603628 RepID=A0A5C8V773_9FLAO|nr:alginate lyase family protein [Flagellimonas hymeniacidonis]TXN37621.1 alginate lyase family protein [Flagellimonas hymeniacidonis]